MLTDLAAPGYAVDAALYSEVNQFYAHHMHLLDAGLADEWAATFTEDGVFAPQTLAEPVRGRASLAAGLRTTVTQLATDGEVHRHWHGMITVRPDGDVLRVRCYALVIATRQGGASRIHRACVCTDELVRVDGRLLVRHRVVTRDDLP